MQGGLVVFFIILLFGVIVLSLPWFQQQRVKRRKLTRRYYDDFAPYVVKHLTQREVPFSLRWTKEKVFAPRPPRGYVITKAHITFPWEAMATVDLAQSDAAAESRRDDDRKQDEDIARRYAARPTVDPAPHADVLTF